MIWVSAVALRARNNPCHSNLRFPLDLTSASVTTRAESHAFARAESSSKEDWHDVGGKKSFGKEFGRQLGKAADRYCPYCALLGDPEL